MGVLMVRKDMVKEWKSRVYSGHVGARKVRAGQGYLEQNGSWKRGRRKQMERRWGDQLPASTPLLGRHVSVHSVIKSVCGQTAYMSSCGLMDSVQPNKISLLQADGWAHWVTEEQSPLHWQTEPLFSIEMVRLPDNPSMQEHEPAHPKPGGEHRTRKDKSTCRELLPATWVCVRPQDTDTVLDPQLRSQGIQQTASKCLLRARLCLESSHRWKPTPGMLMVSDSRTQIAAEFTSDLLSFFQSFFQTPAEQNSLSQSVFCKLLMDVP